MKLNIIVLTHNKIEQTRQFWAALLANTSRDDVGLTVVDNGSTDGTIPYLLERVFPHFEIGQLVTNRENRGLFAGYNQGWRTVQADCHAFLHNDLLILERDWVERLLAEFGDQSIGVVGFGGAKTADPDGGRSGFMSNMADAENHGSRIFTPTDCALLDGMILVACQQMLEAVGGMDESYPRHHYYDKDLCMASLAAGYRNRVLPIWCHHMSGTTACSMPDDEEIKQQSHNKYLQKWSGRLPWRID
jgi:GT2 family glycosyltransferase